MIALVCIGLDGLGLVCIALDWIVELGWFALHWLALDLIRLDFMQLGCIGLAF